MMTAESAPESRMGRDERGQHVRTGEISRPRLTVDHESEFGKEVGQTK